MTLTSRTTRQINALRRSMAIPAVGAQIAMFNGLARGGTASRPIEFIGVLRRLGLTVIHGYRHPVEKERGMRSPSEYSTVPFAGLHVMEVEPGTVIKDERTGREATVTDDSFVTKGRVLFCTKKTFDALRAKVN